MPYRIPRSINQHPRAGETHHFPHPFAHGRFVAVHGALFARTLFFTERAAIQSGMGIVQQRFAFRTEACVLLFLPAVDADHPFYRSFFAGNSVLVHLSKPPSQYPAAFSALMHLYNLVLRHIHRFQFAHQFLQVLLFGYQAGKPLAVLPVFRALGNHIQ